MTRTERRALQRKRAADRAAAGLPPKRPPRKSHYQTADIQAVVQSDLQSMRQQIESQRRIRDHEWAFHQKAFIESKREATLPE